MKINKKFSTAGLGLLAVGALAFGGASAANAVVNLTPAPSTDANSDLYYDDGEEVAFSVPVPSDPDADWRVSLCTVETFGPFNAPACADVEVDLSIANGVATGEFEVWNQEPNAHFGILPGQPSTVDCDDVESCYILLAEHADGGVEQDTSDAFYIN